MPKQKENIEEQVVETAEDMAEGDVIVEEDMEESEDVEVSEDAESVEAESEAVEDVPEEDLIMTLEDVRLVEAMLFASANALTESQIAERFPAGRVKLIPDILENLREHYANRGVNLVQRDKRWALRTATDLADQLRLEKEQPKKFTRAAMETMAVVAYHQPVTRAEIENIRGVATSPGALDALMEAGWIKPGKRREVPGRPVTWLTTQAFLDHFGLEKLTDLPGMEDLKAAGLLDKRPAIEAMPTPDLFEGEEGHDPQEVTDEDLIGKSALTEDDAEEGETLSGEDADDSEEADDQDGDDEDFDGDEDEDSDDEEDSGDDEDEPEDDEDEDYGESDEDGADEAGDEDQDDEDDGDEDFDDEDDEESDDDEDDDEEDEDDE